MKASEVRIGNLVAIGTDRTGWSVIVVGEVDITMLVNYHKSTGKRHSPMYKGIPLTPARLKRFGWVEKEPRKWTLPKFHKFQLEVPISGGEAFTAVKSTGDSTSWVVRTHVAYVHELQNLYFAHEDKELPLKPQVNKDANQANRDEY